MKPVLAISLGDPAGISKEIIAQSLKVACQVSQPVIFGHWESFLPCLESVGNDFDVELVTAFQPNADKAQFVHCGDNGGPIDSPGRRSAVAQFEALERAVDVVLDGLCAGIVTGPVSKKLVDQVCPGFKGHTEYLAKRSGVSPRDVTMVFSGQGLSVGLVATHVPLKDVPSTITAESLGRTVRHLAILSRALRPDSRPLIAVAALNPHGGEGGLLGTEEESIIGPFCHSYSNDELAEVIGPIPADTLFRQAMEGAFDGVVAVYHDQALIPLRLHGVGKMVNVTMGLPFVRTSPDHGVAYDIAGKKLANPAGMQLAIRLAAKLANWKKTGIPDQIR